MSHHAREALHFANIWLILKGKYLTISKTSVYRCTEQNWKTVNYWLHDKRQLTSEQRPLRSKLEAGEAMNPVRMSFS